MQLQYPKRPSFTWLQTHSPRKGLLTILVIVGCFLVTWVPTAVAAAQAALTRDADDDASLGWVNATAYWCLAVGLLVNPVVYGIMNRAIRSEIVPAIFPPRNPALKGLPPIRRNSNRRGSVPGSNTITVLNFR